MFLRFDASLNGQKFSDIAQELILTDIVEMPVTVDTTLSAMANMHGQRLTSNVRTALSVQLVFLIRTQDINLRAGVRDLVATWARDGGMLTVNYRPGLKLYVACTVPPAQESALKWTQELTLTLTAYEIPYWQSETPAELNTITESMGDGMFFAADVLSVPGTAERMPATTIIVKNAATSQTAAMTSVRIDAVDATMTVVENPRRNFATRTKIELTGMSIEPGNGVKITHDAIGTLKITNLKTGESLMSARTAQSDDELMVYPGHDTEIMLSTDQLASLSVSTNGWWL